MERRSPFADLGGQPLREPGDDVAAGDINLPAAPLALNNQLIAAMSLVDHLMEAERVRSAGTDLGRGRGVVVPLGSAMSDLGPLVAGPDFLSLEQEALAPQAPR